MASPNLSEAILKFHAARKVLKQEVDEIIRAYSAKNPGVEVKQKHLSRDGIIKYQNYKATSDAYKHCEAAKVALDMRFGSTQTDSAPLVWAAKKHELTIDDGSEARVAVVTVIVLQTDHAVAFAQLMNSDNTAKISESVFDLGFVRSVRDVESYLRVTYEYNSTAGGRALSLSIEQPTPPAVAIVRRSTDDSQQRIGIGDGGSEPVDGAPADSALVDGAAADGAGEGRTPNKVPEKVAAVPLKMPNNKQVHDTPESSDSDSELTGENRTTAVPNFLRPQPNRAPHPIKLLIDANDYPSVFIPGHMAGDRNRQTTKRLRLCSCFVYFFCFCVALLSWCA